MVEKAETQREYREMTDAELRERLNQIGATVQRIRFQDGREAYYHAKRWASEQNKPIRQELARRLRDADGGAGPGDSAPDAEKPYDPRDYEHWSYNKGWGNARAAYWTGDLNDREP